MRRHLPIRLAVCAALVGSASLAAVAIPGGIASAAAVTVKCKTANGTGASVTSSTTIKLGGCTGAGSPETGATGTAVSVTNHGQPKGKGTETITWKTTGKKSVVSFTYVESAPKSTQCKTVPKGYAAAAYVTQTGTVEPASKGTTTTGMIGGKVTGSSCVFLKVSSPHTVESVGVGSGTY